MASEDPLDLAQTAIVRVADIASLLGVQYKRPICGRLGAELLLVADYLDTAGLDQEERLRLRISKLLRDVEMICTVRTQRTIPRRPQPSLLPCVEAKSSNITIWEPDCTTWFLSSTSLVLIKVLVASPNIRNELSAPGGHSTSAVRLTTV
jgi:hypothetical protein